MNKLTCVSLSLAALVVLAAAGARAADPPPATASAGAGAEAAPEPAPPAPTGDEVNRVVQYFLKGAPAGPVLMESVLCKKTDKIDGKLACVEKLPGKIKKGEAITAFVKFFVPKGAKYDDIKVKFLLDGEVRSTSELTLTEAFSGYSNYKQSTASKAGTWEVQIFRGDTLLSKQTVVVE
jgi:hypothetical protein